MPWRVKKQKNKQNSFIRFLGESMARQFAYGFIWPLTCQVQFGFLTWILIVCTYVKKKCYPLIEKVMETQIEGQWFSCFSGHRPKTKIPFESLSPLALLFENRDNPVLRLAHIHVPKFTHTRVKVLQKSHMYDFPHT